MNIEKKIINFVKKNKFLYDKSKRNYNNVILREKKWNILAKELNIEVQIVKRRWKTLRDAYFKEKKIIQNYERMGEPYVQKWKFFDLMTFIDVTPIEKLTSAICQPNDDPVVKSEINCVKGFDFADEFSSKIMNIMILKEQMNELLNLKNCTSKSAPLQPFFQTLVSLVEAANLPKNVLKELQVSLLQKITSTIAEQFLKHENN